MKIAVINGSPKGKYSVTLQTVRYLEKKFPEHQFSVLNAGQQIKAIEKDFSNVAYATIRKFVLKFEKLGLLSSRKLGNRVKYKINE